MHWVCSTHKTSTKSDFKCIFLLSCNGIFCHFIRIKFDHTSQFLSGINVTFQIRDLQCKVERIP